MAEMNAEPGFSAEDGADEKLGHPSSEVRVTKIISSLKTQVLADGKRVACGVVFCPSIQAGQE